MATYSVAMNKFTKAARSSSTTGNLWQVVRPERNVLRMILERPLINGCEFAVSN